MVTISQAAYGSRIPFSLAVRLDCIHVAEADLKPAAPDGGATMQEQQKLVLQGLIFVLLKVNIFS